MDKIRKAISKLSPEEQAIVKSLLNKILQADFKDLELKKLKGYDNLFRVRKGKIRIIFNQEKDGIKILAVERRSDHTYNF